MQNLLVVSLLALSAFVLADCASTTTRRTPDKAYTECYSDGSCAQVSEWDYTYTTSYPDVDSDGSDSSNSVDSSNSNNNYYSSSKNENINNYSSNQETTNDNYNYNYNYYQGGDGSVVAAGNVGGNAVAAVTSAPTSAPASSSNSGSGSGSGSSSGSSSGSGSGYGSGKGGFSGSVSSDLSGSGRYRHHHGDLLHHLIRLPERAARESARLSPLGLLSGARLDVHGKGGYGNDRDGGFNGRVSGRVY